MFFFFINSITRFTLWLCTGNGTATVPYLGLLIKHKHINNKEFEDSSSLPGKIFSKNKYLEKCINHLGTSPKPVQVIPPSPLGTVRLSHELVEWSKEESGVSPSAPPRLVSPSTRSPRLVSPSTPSPRFVSPQTGDNLECTQTEIVMQKPDKPVTKANHPNIEEVISFFSKNKYPDTEAKKFYNHYQSNGWLVGGKTPMNNWQSSAHKWMLNAIQFNVKPKISAAKDQYNNEKDFSEPL